MKVKRQKAKGKRLQFEVFTFYLRPFTFAQRVRW
jgi:hypothetical protein